MYTSFQGECASNRTIHYNHASAVPAQARAAIVKVSRLAEDDDDGPGAQDDDALHVGRLGIIATVGLHERRPVRNVASRCGRMRCSARGSPVRRPRLSGPPGAISRLLMGSSLTAEGQAVPSWPSTRPRRRPARSSRRR